MSKKYSDTLVNVIREKQYNDQRIGVDVIIKPIPDCDIKGAMDPRLYDNSKMLVRMMRFMPKKMMEINVKNIEKLRKPFNNVDSTNFVKDTTRENVLVEAKDGYKIPVTIFKGSKTLENATILYYIHGGGFFAGTYVEKTLKEEGVEVSSLTDEQKAFLKDDFGRHVLVTIVDDAKVAAKWSNNIQSFTEGIGLGIPVNISTDSRHAPSANTEFNVGAGGDISKWPEPLGLAATFDKDIVKDFGLIAAKEYGTLRIRTALSPQIDLASEPRCMRFNVTFGEDTKLATDLAKAYIDGFQTSTKG